MNIHVQERIRVEKDWNYILNALKLHWYGVDSSHDVATLSCKESVLASTWSTRQLRLKKCPKKPISRVFAQKLKSHNVSCVSILTSKREALRISFLFLFKTTWMQGLKIDILSFYSKTHFESTESHIIIIKGLP